MKLVKNGVFSLIASAVFSVFWILLLNVFEPLRDKNYEFFTFIVFIAVSVGLALLFMRKYLHQEDKSVFKRIGCVAVISALSFAVIVGVFYITIFGLLYHYYP